MRHRWLTRKLLAMSSPEVVMEVLRRQLRAAGMTYRELARRIGMSESSIKRIFGQRDMALSRLANICQAAGIAMEEVLREAADLAPHPEMLTLAQERSLTADPKLLLVAICCLGHWTMAQIVETYRLSSAECIRCLARLDRLGLIVLKPGNAYRLNVSPTFHWRANGPVQHYFRAHVVQDYFGGSFDGDGDVLLCLPSRLAPGSAREAVHKIRQLAADIARLQQQDRRLDAAERDGYTLLVGFRSWEFSAFTALRRESVPVSAHQNGPRNT